MDPDESSQTSRGRSGGQPPARHQCWSLSDPPAQERGPDLASRRRASPPLTQPREMKSQPPAAGAAIAVSGDIKSRAITRLHPGASRTVRQIDPSRPNPLCNRFAETLKMNVLALRLLCRDAVAWVVCRHLLWVRDGPRLRLAALTRTLDTTGKNCKVVVKIEEGRKMFGQA